MEKQAEILPKRSRKHDKDAAKDNAGGRQVETRSGVNSQDKSDRDRNGEGEASLEAEVAEDFR